MQQSPTKQLLAGCRKRRTSGPAAPEAQAMITTVKAKARQVTLRITSSPASKAGILAGHHPARTKASLAWKSKDLAVYLGS